MNMSLRSLAAPIFALAALPLAACGGSSTTNGSGGSGTGGGTTTSTMSTGVASTCAGYCEIIIPCLESEACTLVDPAGARAVCETSCEAAFLKVTSAEADLVEGCLGCIIAAASPGV